jgi:hypothetical protein
LAWFSLSTGQLHVIVLADGLVITAVLAVITWIYRARPASPGQMPAAPPSSPEAAADAALRRELRAQVAFLSRILNELPTADSSRLTEALLNGDDLRDFSFPRFRALVSELGAASDSTAAIVETNLSWLGALIREVRSKRSGLHYDWNSFPRHRYNKVLRSSRPPLQQITSRLAGDTHAES